MFFLSLFHSINILNVICFNWRFHHVLSSLKIERSTDKGMTLWLKHVVDTKYAEILIFGHVFASRALFFSSRSLSNKPLRHFIAGWLPTSRLHHIDKWSKLFSGGLKRDIHKFSDVTESSCCIFIFRWMTITMEWWTIARIDKVLRTNPTHLRGPMHEATTTPTTWIIKRRATTAITRQTMEPAVRTVRWVTTRCWRVAAATTTTWTATTFGTTWWDLQPSTVPFWTVSVVGTVLMILCLVED